MTSHLEHKALGAGLRRDDERKGDVEEKENGERKSPMNFMAPPLAQQEVRFRLPCMPPASPLWPSSRRTPGPSDIRSDIRSVQQKALDPGLRRDDESSGAQGTKSLFARG
jgi:hypothetical protein